MPPGRGRGGRRGTGRTCRRGCRSSPAARRRGVGRHRTSQGWASHSSSVAPIRTRSPGRSRPAAARRRSRAGRGRAGSARPTPRRRSSSAPRSARSACRGPGRPRPRPRSTLKPSPIASIRWTTTPAGSGGAPARRRRAGGRRSGRGARRARPRRPRRSRRRPRPSFSRAARNAGQASAAAGRSILLKATRIGFSSRAGSWARSSSRITSWSQPGSRPEPSTMWMRTRVRSTWRRKAWPRPGPARRALDQARARRRSSAVARRRRIAGSARSMTPRFGSSVVNG